MRGQSPGTAFEQAVIRSLPRGSYHRKSPTPARPAPVRELCAEIHRCIEVIFAAATELDLRLSAGASVSRGLFGSDVAAPEWVEQLRPLRHRLGAFAALDRSWIANTEKLAPQFTSAAGVDLVITAPANGAMMVDGLPKRSGSGTLRPGAPAVIFSLECKSVADNRLAFDALRETQAKELARCAEAGHVAGILAEFRAAGEVWYLPQAAWREERLTATRKSIALERAREIGVKVERDEVRGRGAAYWKMAEFMRKYGAEV